MERKDEQPTLSTMLPTRSKPTGPPTFPSPRQPSPRHRDTLYVTVYDIFLADVTINGVIKMNSVHLHGQPGPPNPPLAALDHQPIPGAVWMGPGRGLIAARGLRSKKGWRDGGLATIQVRQTHNLVTFIQRNQTPLAARAALRSLPDTRAASHGIMLSPKVSPG